MIAISSTRVRSEWSMIVDSVVREKPVLIKRTRDHVFLANTELLCDLLEAYTFHAALYPEKDGSVTISLDEIDLIDNGRDELDAKLRLAQAILDYSIDYYSDFTYWSRGNRKSHKPYIFKALILGDITKIGGFIECRRGEI